ncbi:MAG TPA: Asp-tRNA(Asn)/Glu-tRNA(Gln) amidotransferase subunit GatB [Candidatus Monoglobus merdigallinarum]|uniref:Aspartyl/glutamyl-tRNA(Asn/Gln) amidotransferase subunit B n=1 Tax=Candidatus Monoglobus merdigallinarum TaxID=2838698 RepID=A0A9D1PQ91_9FIRM|nr:Asp-tRNA(Asn)/Glu-tRNA(Gln) amidotransferase subunit GatB [Candidatus Monoglobus merdigallinarum]
MAWETVMGLEVHVELATKSKIFCSCTTEFGGEPNTHCCPVCTGMPGTLPVANRQVVNYAMKAGIALNCEITRYNKFDRKNYFYPDLPKAYQISQLYLPICRNGRVPIETETGVKKEIRIHEIHMEEDAGKLIHDDFNDVTKCDYNRCGVPLIEIVSEPDFRSAEEVIAYLTKLKSTLEYLGVSDCKMQEGSMRADVNLSVRQVGAEEFGTRTEMKNLNSFKAIAKAINYETKRQIDVLERGGRVIQETRRWDDNKDKSYAMRSKENAQDYRYFPEPDIPPIEIDDQWYSDIKNSLPELADAKKIRYMEQYNLPEYDADMITSQKALADFFEATTDICNNPKEVSNWIMGELMRKLSDEAVEAKDMKLTPASLAKLIELVEKKTINRNKAKEIFGVAFKEELDVEKYVKDNNLEQVSDEGMVLDIVKKVIASNQKAVDDYNSGNKKAIGFLMGQCMKELKGKGDPGVVNKLLSSELNNQ